MDKWFMREIPWEILDDRVRAEQARWAAAEMRRCAAELEEEVRVWLRMGFAADEIFVGVRHDFDSMRMDQHVYPMSILPEESR